ncbi:testis-expressed protein 43-like [Erpetoichthys calabaricus]|uniref:testis-expressed protein 43-like n=1 Tax=Erpetoichthys calabaricus TaxID=27687 RepID=UPI00223427BB|nr:testis-expressed protein 43-like [Erpetoichthys calabaricus]
MDSIATNTDIKGLVHVHLPVFSASLPVIPKRYIMPWKKDMKNRKSILKNAALAEIPHGPHDASLFWEHRERLCHSEPRAAVLMKTQDVVIPGVLNPPNGSHYSRFLSSVINRRDMQ